MPKVLLCPIHVPYTKCVSFQHKPKRSQGGHVWDGGVSILEAPFDVNECIFFVGPSTKPCNLLCNPFRVKANNRNALRIYTLSSSIASPFSQSFTNEENKD